MDQLNDLLIRCGKQDGDAFRRLYQLAAPRLFALCRRLMRDEELAEDVLQEGFVKIWSNAAAFSTGRGSAMTWMTTIMRNQALDRLRMANSRPQLNEQGDYETLAFASPEPGPADLQELNEDTRQLLHCLEQLKPEQRECILSAFYYGHTHDELATQMTRPLGTIKAWIRRGMEQLRQCMAQLAPSS
ncbi:MAG: sigma-70 family RNA polymerase sigma factor [Thiolinea sp.]